MKKNVLLIVALVICLAFTAAGCGGKEKEDYVKLYDYDLTDYIILGQYKGLHESMAAFIDSWYEIRSGVINNGAAIEFTEGVVEKGDMANIDFIGFKDGVPFEGGTGNGIDLMIGSGQFIPGFEDGLIGVQIGGMAVLELTFPENYGAPDLAGQDVEFSVVINSVKKPDPETFKKELLWDLAKRNSTVLIYPEQETNDALAEIETYYHNGVASMGMTWENFLMQYGMTQADADAMFLEMAQQRIIEDMMVLSITKQEGLELTEAEYNEGKLKFLTGMGFESEKAYKDANQGKSFEDVAGRARIELLLLHERVMDFIFENAAS